jgi:RAB protein geranylgeranyltransferase component A
MYKDLDDKCFDHVVIGTSLCDTILSSYLAKCGKKILHLDISKVYGGDCKNLSYRDLENCKICLIKIDLNDYKNGKIYDQYLNNLVLIKEQYNIENVSILI